MGWETRQRGGSYYTRSRREGGRVVREYVGCGEVARLCAQMDELSRGQAQMTRQDTREARRATEAQEDSVRAFCADVEAVLRQTLAQSGYHRHKRGNWRKRRGTAMAAVRQTNPVKTNNIPATANPALTQEQQDLALLMQAEKDPLVPAWKVRQALARMDNPPRTNLTHAAEDFLLLFLGKEDTVKQECLRREIDAVRRQAAGPNPSPLESLLAERVAVCWAHLQIVERLYTGVMGRANVMDSMPHHKRIEMCQRRYLSAIKTLAQVRRLQLPALQINVGQNQNIGNTQNIAEKQVNVNA